MQNQNCKKKTVSPNLQLKNITLNKFVQMPLLWTRSGVSVNHWVWTIYGGLQNTEECVLQLTT